MDRSESLWAESKNQDFLAWREPELMESEFEEPKGSDESATYPLHRVWGKTRKHYFPGTGGLLAYEEHGSAFVVAGDPMAAGSAGRAKVLKEFIAAAHAENKAVCGYYFSKDVATQASLVAHQAGVSSFVDLPRFSLQGKRRSEIRRALNHGDRSNLKFQEIQRKDWLSWKQRLLKLENRWLKTKAGPRIGFLLSSIARAQVRSGNERCFVVLSQEGEVQAFVTLLSYQSECQNKALSVYVDHMVQVPGAHPFAMDYLLSRLILLCQQEGFFNMCLGFNAFCRIKPSTTFESLMKKVGESSLIYNAKSLYYYKSKFSDYERKRFLLIDPHYSSWKQMMAILSATYKSHSFKDRPQAGRSFSQRIESLQTIRSSAHV